MNRLAVGTKSGCGFESTVDQLHPSSFSGHEFVNNNNNNIFFLTNCNELDTDRKLLHFSLAWLHRRTFGCFNRFDEVVFDGDTLCFAPGGKEVKEEKIH